MKYILIILTLILFPTALFVIKNKFFKDLRLFWEHLKDSDENYVKPFKISFLYFLWKTKIRGTWDAIYVNTKKVEENIAMTARLALLLVEKYPKTGDIHIKHLRFASECINTHLLKRNLRQFITTKAINYKMEGLNRLLVFLPKDSFWIRFFEQELGFSYSSHLNHALNYELKSNYHILHLYLNQYEQH